MSSFRAQRDLIAALIVSAVLWPTSLFAQSQVSPTPPDQASRVSVTYVPPENELFASNAGARLPVRISDVG
jgi:hypothetical protein